MATHSKKVSNNGSNKYQVFTNDTSATNAVVFTTGDYIDFKTSLGRDAKKVKFILTGTVAIEILFNTELIVMKRNLEEADSSIVMPESMTNNNVLRLFTTSRLEFETPDGFSVNNIKLVSYSGAASGTQNLTIIGF